MGTTGVDLYIGGAEHAVLHLLYARFWHKVLFDIGVVTTPEPFRKLVNQGIILGEDGQKMSKARGNVINPDSIVSEYGADTLRLFEMFLGPLEQMKPWSTTGIEGVYRFLGRVWRLVMEEDQEGAWHFAPAKVTDAAPSTELLRSLHAAIQKVTDHIDRLQFNTAISALMVLVNDLTKEPARPRAVVKTLLQLLAPFAPHMAEELWAQLGGTKSLTYEPWPVADARYPRPDRDRVPHAGQRQAPRRLQSPRRLRQGRRRGHGQRAPRLRRMDRRQDRQESHLRPQQADQLRRGLRKIA